MVWRQSLLASAVLAATLVTGAVLAAPSPAQTPADELSEATGCQLSLSSPQLVVLPGGGKAVKASLEPDICAPSAQPTDVRVCVSTPNGPGDCKQTPGWSTAEVFVPAAPAKGTFTATGQICWQDILGSFVPGCRSATTNTTF
jgi:hypothetical protein